MKIDKNDMKKIEEMAKKYNISIKVLGKMIEKSQSVKTPVLQVRYSEKEFRLLESKIEKLNAKFNIKIDRSTYSILCLKAIMQNRHEINILNVIGVIGERKKENQEDMRSKRVPVSFNAETDYNEMLNFADTLGVKFSCLMRYAALNVELIDLYDK